MLNLPFNFANVIVIPLLIGLGVASSIHVVIRARETAWRGDGDSILETSAPRAVLLADAHTAEQAQHYFSSGLTWAQCC
jgi:hypothetical protein